MAGGAVSRVSRDVIRQARQVTDAERRARIGHRHGLAAGARFADILGATRGMTVLHATEPATVHLSLRARVDGISIADVECALYEDRTVVKQGAMRSTLFGFPRDLLPAAWGSAGARHSRAFGTRLAKDLVAAGITEDGPGWIAEVGDSLLSLLSDGRQLSPTDLRALVPRLDVKIERAPGTKWGATTPVGPQLLSILNGQGRVLRAGNPGHWRLSKPTWTATEAWLGERPEALDERVGYAELVRRWLWTFGPGTEADLRWWLGSTLGSVRMALADCAAVPVGLDDGATGWLLPDDLEVVEPAAPWVALLPTLDPTVMGWTGRDFYIGSRAPALFDSVGNAGTTVWRDGRVVGTWIQDGDDRVRVHLLDSVPARVARRIDAEAERLTDWLDGVRIVTIYVSAAMKEAATTG